MEKQLTVQGKKIEELEKAPRKISEHIENVHQEILNKKDKEIVLLKTELNLSK